MNVNDDAANCEAGSAPWSMRVRSLAVAPSIARSSPAPSTSASFAITKSEMAPAESATVLNDPSTTGGLEKSNSTSPPGVKPVPVKAMDWSSV